MKNLTVVSMPVVAGMLALGIVLITSMGAYAAHGCPASPATINQCGCVINAAGLYAVGADLTGSSGSDCIQIKTASALLNVQGHSITGPGAAGIHVLRGASSLMLEGQGAAISRFNVGILIEGSKVVGEHFKLSNNLVEGLTISKVRQVLLSDIIANSNGASGVRITGGGTNGVSSFTANQNAGSGVLIQGSSTNLIGQFTAKNNSNDGVFVTCIPKKGVSGAAAASCGPGSAGNLVYDGVASDNGNIGIEIGAGSKKGNFVGDNTAQSNASKVDLADDTPGCGGLLGNNWFTNDGTPNQNATASCVH